MSFLFYCTLCHSQETQIKTPFPIKSLSWNNTSSYFAYCEDNHVFIRDAETLSLFKTINEQNVSSILFSSEGRIKNDVLLTLTEKGKFCVWDFYSKDDTEPQTTIHSNTNLDITSISFSNNSDYIAFADTNNSINLFFKLRYTHQTIKRTIQAHSKEIFGLKFSPDNKYLVSSSIESKAKIWTLNDSLSVVEIPFYSGSKVPAIFSSNSKYIIATTNNNSFAVYNLKGELLREIKSQSNIKDISALPFTDMIAVLNDQNIIELYLLDDFSYLGYIPPYNISDITCYAFNSDSNYVLVGHQDGTICKLSVKDSFFKPTEEPPALRIITSEESNAKTLITGTNAGKSRITLVPSYKPFNSLVYSLGASINSYPFLYGYNGSIEFHHGKFISPFFFGLGFGGDFSLPVKDFPYSYSINGEKTKSPYLLGMSCYLPFGLLLKPWKSDIYLNTEIKIGCKVYSFLLTCNQGILPGTLNASMYCASNIGAFYKNFGLNFLVEYDTIAGFYPSLMISYQQKFKNKRGAS